MSGSCHDKSCEIEALQQRQTSTLKIVLVINAVMFVVEIGAGLLASSVSLLADSLDMLGDTLVYGFSIYAVARGARMKAVAATFKGIIMLLFGLFVLGQAIWHILYPEVPVYLTMGGIGVLALLANGACLLLLWRHRGEDINMRSVWLCSRNDIIANLSVLVAAAAVWALHTPWPDIIVGLSLAALFLRSAWEVLAQARQQLRPPTGGTDSVS